MERHHLFENKEMTLLDLLDGIIDTGVVVRGEILISIANIDLIVVDLKLLISSIESAFGSQERKNGGEVIVNGTDTLRLEQGRARISEISSHNH
ncbi:gas vesicle protein [Neobacillus sp. NRS-1170]|uniref:gas vesicle protein n=1 Tax=Neobacillus sp. NRS-1170 TaxID=3233898 RepID=UPI003D284481